MTYMYKITFKDGETKVIEAPVDLILALVNSKRSDCIYHLTKYLIYTDEIKYIEVITDERSES